MRTLILAILSILAIALAPATLARSSTETTKTLELGRTMTQEFYRGELATIAAAMSEEMSNAIGGEAGLEAFRGQVAQQLGEEVSLLDETVSEVQGARVYTRTARFEGYGGPVVVQWAFDADGTVVGFFVQPGQATVEAASEYLDYTTKTDLRLPFDGTWTVFWGGRDIEQNYHAAYADQRFAYDLVVARDGETHADDGRENEDYYCFGLPILAPGDGVVIAVEGSVPDNLPDEFDDEGPLGNHVIIDHGNGEFSFLAHLRAGSPTVQPGEAVDAGDVIAECGNSGRSSEPHLHYHLQTTAVFGAGEGLPAQFQNYRADGEPVERGEPVQGQIIEAVQGRQ